ncbi:MAG: DUF4956 domain-containing protein [Bacteroidales bacterium]|nr:DUF4956 domain-containing protein [Bacteroidales bacterium]MDD4640674.1 DUF4956 domain-containing protein [Bacteroidales bacterium]
MEEFAEILQAEELLEAQALATPIFNAHDLWELLFRFFFNFAVIAVIIHFFYYKKSRRVDYYFTFIIISVSMFFLIYLLGSVKLKIGFALGIFAIFGIIRYRTEQVPIREMTYLFTITAISVINALSVQMSYTQMVATNLIIILVIWGLETSRWLKHTSSKMVLYDRIQLILPEKEPELIADLKKRTGLNILRIEIGHIDFSRDIAFIKVYYESDREDMNTVDNVTRFPKWSNE